MEKRTVDVLELARNGGAVEGELEAGGLARLAPLLVAPMGSIHFHFQGHLDARGRPAARLRIDGHLGLSCDLCGETLAWPLNESEEFFFVEDEAQLGALPITVDGEEPLLASRQFDLNSLIEEQVLLALPISSRHPACQRLAQAQAPEQGATRPFEVLGSLRRGRTDIQ
jgi:uncharacterized protein